MNEASGRVLVFAFGIAAGCGVATAYSHMQRSELAMVLRSSEAVTSMLAKVHEECRSVRGDVRRMQQSAPLVPALPSPSAPASAQADEVPAQAAAQAASPPPEEPEAGDWDKAIKAQSLLDGALRAGTWDLAARDQLRLLDAEMPDAERERIHLEIARNLNEGKLRFASLESPF